MTPNTNVPTPDPVRIQNIHPKVDIDGTGSLTASELRTFYAQTLEVQLTEQQVSKQLQGPGSVGVMERRSSSTSPVLVMLSGPPPVALPSHAHPP